MGMTESAPGHQTIFNCILAGQCFTIIGVNCGIFCAGCPAWLPRPPGDTKLEPRGNNPRHNRVGGAEQLHPSITPATRHKGSAITPLLSLSLIPRFIKNGFKWYPPLWRRRVQSGLNVSMSPVDQGKARGRG